MTLKGRAAIIGTGETRMMKDYTGSVYALAVEAAMAALNDCGLSLADIDGLITVQSNAAGSAFNVVLAGYLGLNPTYSADATVFGASPAFAVKQAAEAIAAGTATTVLVVGADLTFKQILAQGGRFPRVPLMDDYEIPYGSNMANTNYALVAQLHQHLYGTTDEMRAKICVDQRFNASYNPNSLFGHLPLTVEDVLNSRVVSSPLRLLECVYTCSGGFACVVTSAEHARTLGPVVPVFIEGAGFHQSHLLTTEAPLWDNGLQSAVAVAGKQAYEMAGVGPEQIDVLGLYDCYPIAVIIELEDLGFCKKGEGGPFVAEHDLTFKGDTPLNTSGGQLSVGQVGDVGGMVNLLEVVRQLQGKCGDRQVKDAEFGIVNCNGGAPMSTECTLILRRGA
ncbi:MAG: thiolase family protein [Alicyclobacillus macrosporangiidus]|uniref:thiolase family protein n=1 Tax=Alicyclobacillus macrosporangiidus TaxID=392015 RepID=UPI0026EF9F21|nr:thiolase family protein [Alicyclobacillus macrosporangiidus]MCL6600183.1 thiolase family protein [Alicyclobacillus macrosporangiidus]